jgi:hypothetical protein
MLCKVKWRTSILGLEQVNPFRKQTRAMTNSWPGNQLPAKRYILGRSVKTASEKKQSTQQTWQRRISYQIDTID